MDEEFFDRYSKIVKKKEGIPGFQMNSPLVSNTLKGTVGLEIEMEATNRLPADGALEAIKGKTTKCRWLTTQDGSLRGSAIEYLFSGPCSRDEIEPMITGLYDAIALMRTNLSLSNRCSTHVHINIAGRTINQISSILALWAVFEEALIEWCGEERKTNHFALSMQNANSLVDTWNNFLRYGHTSWPEGLKYSALNVLPIWTQGSIEFRCGPASENPRVPINWATFLDTFVEYACTAFRHPAEIGYALSERGGYEIFSDICRDPALSAFRAEVLALVGDEERLNKMCLQGFRTVQSFALGYPWEQWMALIQKEYIPDPFAKKAVKKTPYVALRGMRHVPFPDAPVPAPEPRAQDQADAEPIWMRVAREAELRERGR